MRLKSNKTNREAMLEFGVFHWVSDAKTSLPGLLPSGHPSAEFFKPIVESPRKDPAKIVDAFDAHLKGWRAKVSKPLILCSGGVDSSVLVATASKAGHVCDLLHTAYLHHDNNDLEKLSGLLENFPAAAQVFSVSENEYLRGMEIMRRNGTVQNTYAPTITYALGAAAKGPFESLVTGSGPDELFYGMEKYPLDYFESRKHLPASQALEEIDTPYNLAAYRRVLNSKGLDILEAVLTKRRRLYAAIAGICPSIYDAQRLLAYCTVTAQHMDLFDELAGNNGLKHVAPFLNEELIRIAFSIPIPDLFDPNRTNSKVEVGKFHLKKFLSGYMPREHVFSKKIGFHAPTTRFLHQPAFAPVFERVDFERLPDFFELSKLRAEVSSRFADGPEKSSRDYFLYSLLNLSAACSD